MARVDVFDPPVEVAGTKIHHIIEVGDVITQYGTSVRDDASVEVEEITTAEKRLAAGIAAIEQGVGAVRCVIGCGFMAFSSR